MPNPDGTDRNEPERSDERTVDDAGTPGRSGEADPATDAFERADPDSPETGERRYTAPGFDAGSTQIIDRVPDPPTEMIGTPEDFEAVEPPDAAPVDDQQRNPGPQAIPARSPRRPRWRTPVLIAVAGALLAAAVVVGLVQYDKARKASQQQQVRAAITAFDEALAEGDLATLRTITCGQTRDAYVEYDDEEWTETYSKVMAAGQYPVVASIDEVVIDGDHAEANVTSYLAADPDTRSTRSFDLQLTDGQWKICQAS